MSSINKLKYNGQEYDLYGLGGDVLPIGSEIDIASDAEIPAGWEEVDDKYEIYSETERCIGRWIDGKPLYRKILKFKINKYTSGSLTQDISLNDIAYDYIMIDKAIVTSFDGTIVNNRTYLPFTRGDNVSHSKMYISVNDKILRYVSNDNQWEDGECITILEYTKTTDTANTPITKKIRKVTQSVPPAILDNYSEEETIVGTWINGKPLYRKVLDIKNFIKGSVARTTHNIANIDDVINYEMYLVRGSTHNLSSAYRIETIEDNSTSNGNNIVGYYVSRTEVCYFIGNSWSENNLSLRVIIQYTKTTD